MGRGFSIGRIVGFGLWFLLFVVGVVVVVVGERGWVWRMVFFG